MKNFSMAIKRLRNEYKSLTKDSTDGILAGPCGDDFFHWDAVIMCVEFSSSRIYFELKSGPADTPYEGGFFEAKLHFPSTYPIKPPEMIFETEMWHPNIYPDGRICISILHTDENQTFSEPSNERWTPSQSIESILLSVMSLLASPNIMSPANIDAAKEYRDDPELFNRNVKKTVLKSLKLTADDLV